MGSTERTDGPVIYSSLGSLYGPDYSYVSLTWDFLDVVNGCRK